MNDETRRAALRATRALALGAAAVACTSSTSTTPAPAPANTSTGPADCAAITDRAFPDGDPYPYPKEKASAQPAVQECCRTAIAGYIGGRQTDPVMERHRWGCCASVDHSGDRQVAMACTPWGPPVPPPMGFASAAARRRRNARSA